eukprot:361073-Chlamydomonas_euryale.AAC.3
MRPSGITRLSNSAPMQHLATAELDPKTAEQDDQAQKPPWHMEGCWGWSSCSAPMCQGHQGHVQKTKRWNGPWSTFRYKQRFKWARLGARYRRRTSSLQGIARTATPHPLLHHVATPRLLLDRAAAPRLLLIAPQHRAAWVS